jgi:hypothetical protein
MFSFGGPSPFDTEEGMHDDNPFGVSSISTVPTIFNTTPLTEKQQTEINNIVQGRKYDQIDDVPFDFTFVLCDTADEDTQNVILEVPVHYNIIKHYVPSICNETSESMTRENRVMLPLDVLENEVTPTSLQKLVDFIYNNQVPVPEIHEVVSMLTLSDFLVFDALRDECIKILVPKVTESNAIQMLGWSSGLHDNWSGLMNAAMSIIISKFESIVQTTLTENASAPLQTVRIDTIVKILKTALVPKFFHYYRFQFLSLWMRERCEIDINESRFNIIAEYLKIKKSERMDEREFTTPMSSTMSGDIAFHLESDFNCWSYFIEEIIVTETCINFKKYEDQILQQDVTVLKMILCSDYLGIDSEDEIVKFLLKWGKNASELYSECVRWAFVSSQVIQEASNGPHFNLEEIFGSDFAQAVKNKTDPPELAEKYTRVRKYTRERFDPNDKERPKLNVNKLTSAEIAKLFS